MGGRKNKHSGGGCFYCVGYHRELNPTMRERERTGSNDYLVRRQRRLNRKIEEESKKRAWVL